MTTRKAAVFGLDGITFDLIQPWIDAGRFPNLARLMAEGASAHLRSTIPPVSASAWPSFFTGTNPGQHGVIDFTYPTPGGYEITVSNSHTCAVPAVWDIVGQAGGQVGVVSMPMTYPPNPVNGFVVCSFLTPSADSQYTYPTSLQEEIESAVGPFPLHMSEKGRGTDPRRFIQAVKDMETARARAVKYLLRSKPWDFFVYVFETTDNLQHEVWHLLDTTHPRHDPDLAAAVMPDILDYYETVDRLLGDMVALVPNNGLTVVLSDHGFGPFHKFFHINNWLAEQGLLKFRRSPLSLTKRLAFRAGATPINALKWVTRLRLSSMRKNVKRGRGRGMLRRVFLSFDNVDWTRTRAFSVGNFGQVYLNVRGQRHHGPVTADEYDTLRDRIAASALALRDPVDGSQVVQQVYRREEIFRGSRTDRLPDLILHTDRARYVSFGHAEFGSNQIIEPSVGQTGHHHMVGVLVLHGPGVHQGLRMDEASMLDVVPTLLHYMGLAIPTYMDGKVLTQAFTDELNHTTPIRYDDAAYGTVAEDTGYAGDEEQAVIEKLRDMGYVA
jgi:predicted AlkP superfamily phosphohydrolase/phosphomutase